MMSSLHATQWVQHATYLCVCERLERLAHVVEERDPNILAIILYGSIARLTPHRMSDLDVFLIVQDEAQFASAPAASGDRRGIALLSEAEYPAYPEMVAWSFSPLAWAVDQLTHVEETLVENIGRDGVLVYSRGSWPLPTLPSPWKALASYPQWKQRVEHWSVHVGLAPETYTRLLEAAQRQHQTLAMFLDQLSREQTIQR
jgi:Polymerase beta, Nucleotidyltransferase